jgi:NitT/TauT family transport system substrate-binding protein
MTHNTKASLGLALFLSAIAVSLLVLSFETPQAKESPIFTVGIATWPGFAPGFIGKEKGFFGKLPVNFVILDDFSVRQNAFTSGETHATISTLDSYAFESGQGVNGNIIMILDESFGADAIIANPRIQAAQDLKGTKVAYTRGSPSHFFLIRYLYKYGMTMKDITRVEVDDPGRAGEAFVSGSVDAAVTWEPNITQIVTSGKGHILESTKTAPGLIVDVMVVNPDVFKTRTADLQTFVNGWLRSVEYIKSQPRESYSIMAKNLRIAENEFPQMAEGLRYADIDTNRAWLLPAEHSKAITLFNDAVKIWLAEGLISKPQSGSNLITTEFIDRHK